ncbi:MAG: CsgG/HfaB family protein [Puniceicoccaceae bacterium]
MKKNFIPLSLLLLLPSLLSAQKLTLGVGPVEVNQSVTNAAFKEGARADLNRVVESLDSTLIDRFQNTRKFDLIARSDLAPLIAEQQFSASGNVDANDPNAARSFQVAGVQYLVLTTVTDFQNYEETARFEAIGREATKRIVRLSAVAKIYDTSTGRLLESANLTIDEKNIRNEPAYQSTTTGDLSDNLLLLLSNEMAQKVTDRTVEVLFPARILAVNDKVVTINRGDGTDVSVGQIWKVFAAGEDLVDPDTGEVLGSNEIEVGTVRITRVLPKFSQAAVVEDLGIDKLQILRRQP